MKDEMALARMRASSEKYEALFYGVVRIGTDRYGDRVVEARVQMQGARCRKHRVADFVPPFIRNNPYLSVLIRTGPPSTRSGACLRVSGAAR